MAEFINSPVMSVSVKLDMTSDATVAQASEAVVASKLDTIKGIKKNATLAEYNQVAQAFYGTIGGGSYDSLTAVRKISEGVAD